METAPVSFIIRFPDTADSLPLAEIFPNGQPLDVDVGCGKGRFLFAKATGVANHNYLGIDRRLKRIQKVDRKLVRAGVTNVRLLCGEALAVISGLPTASVTTYYLFFPDPWPKRRHHRRRLVAESFLESIHRTLAPAGLLHVKTDNHEYFEQIHGLFQNDKRFQPEPPYEPTEDERTEFELVFSGLNVKIERCSFRKIRV
jgi:tRNA (guanine-N7-)-methyltransferase